MKTFLAILFSATTALSASANDFDRRLCGHDLPGHLRHNQCYAYAVALKEQLDICNIPAVWVSYEWERDGRRDKHIAVIFLYKGKPWFMDNSRIAPALVRGDTDLAAVQNLSADRRVVSMLDGANGERRAPQRLASLLEVASKLTSLVRAARIQD